VLSGQFTARYKLLQPLSRIIWDWVSRQLAVTLWRNNSCRCFWTFIRVVWPPSLSVPQYSSLCNYLPSDMPTYPRRT
jgi:hypothetical protein